MAKYNMRLLEK